MTREENIKTARKLLRYMEQKKLKEFSELFAENGKWVHPYHSEMFPEKYVGKKEIYDGIKNTADKFDEVKFPIDRIIPFQDPNGVVVKHTGKLHLKDGIGAYENDDLAILSFDEHGKIIEWIEYYNPIKSAKAFGLLDKLN
jgi:ketosteroid isomerase-like protein